MTTPNDFVVSSPTLDRWEVRVTRLPQSSGGHHEVAAIGWCARRRKPLWSHVEVVDTRGGAQRVSDVVHHLSLVCEQDSPVTLQGLLCGLLGEAWDQPELPLDF